MKLAENMNMSENQLHRLILLSVFVIGIIMGIVGNNVIVGGLIGLGVGFFVIVIVSWSEREPNVKK